MNRSIEAEIAIPLYSIGCDGCGEKIETGAKYISGIESCCGSGCCRVLCAVCVQWAYHELYGEDNETRQIASAQSASSQSNISARQEPGSTGDITDSNNPS